MTRLNVKPSKYRAKPTTVDGIRFASQREAKRYGELKLLEKAGEIEDLQIQPEFTLDVNDVRIGVYRADFAYYPTEPRGPHRGAVIGDQVVEDSKGFRTPLYRWKKKHVEAQYGIVIREL